MVDDTAGSGDKDVDLQARASENSGEQEETHVTVSAAEASSPSDGPPEEPSEPRKWNWAVIFLCIFGFMSSIKPGEPFITPYLLSTEKNFTQQQVSGALRQTCYHKSWFIFPMN